ncbi:flagellar assembly peptidoglycan hydrolase FlgJ [Rhodanobacter sp. 7MK24]|uniref:flagellar assembly peptidoglycan hydrolase FlgJ n=1 Tax=Rhodanobacter sp. 7MK24 TaxID=2775922 RepID=UPI00177CE07A|nr:flagellar assembly peptidoglycan hydrolase FlgJ [Rhodanobacter sp. 7MK24]MBD8881893.1 flagellar assembly peptidoglycan hydrolase FlgJ [Rhodanobacter sp. 7MK24]
MSDAALPSNNSLSTWTDLSGFNRLRAQAQSDSKAVLPAVAKQFEAMFTQMMLKSMREASDSLGDAMGDSDAGKTYRDLFDQQLSVSLSQSGKGLGIAQMLVRQLGGQNASAAGAAGGANGSADDPDGIGDPTKLPANADQFQRRLANVVEAGRELGRSAMKWLPQDAQEFVRALAPYAEAAAQKLGVSVRTVLAQAALETQWGKHMPRSSDGSTSFNLFGMKAGGSWDGQKVSVPTLEYEDGVAVRRHAQFRAYSSPAQSFQDYASLIASNPRYAAAKGHGDDVRGFANALAQGGYATDPDYAEKISAIANSSQMHQALAALRAGI